MSPASTTTSHPLAVVAVVVISVVAVVVASVVAVVVASVVAVGGRCAWVDGPCTPPSTGTPTGASPHSMGTMG